MAKYVLEDVEQAPTGSKYLLQDVEKDTEGTEEGVLQELGEGIASGLLAIPQGIAELAGAGIDLMFDTNYSANATRNANEIREALGLDPEGLVGKGAEVITQFVVPGLGAASAVSKGSKLGKLQRSGAELNSQQKFALGAEQVSAAIGADIMVSTDGITTIGDFFEGGPTQTDQEVGLTGREEALRRLSNKLKVGAETGAIVATAPVALAGAGAALMKTADVVGTAATSTGIPQAIGRGITESRVVTGTRDYLDRIEAVRVFDETQSAFSNVLADTLGALRYRGLLPQDRARLDGRDAPQLPRGRSPPLRWCERQGRLGSLARHFDSRALESSTSSCSRAI